MAVLHIFRIKCPHCGYVYTPAGVDPRIALHHPRHGYALILCCTLGWEACSCVITLDIRNGLSSSMMRTGIRWLVVVLGFGLGIMAGPALPALEIGKANAESNQGRGLELLSRAARSYEAGSYADAAEQVDSAFKAGLTGELAARAILLRAEINERSGASAKALQDYSNALWMEALSPADRKKASDGKERVLASMGLNSGGVSGASWQASAQSGSSSSGVSGFFTGVFSGAENTPPPPPRPAEEAPRLVSAPVSSASATATQSGSSSSGVWGFFSGVFSGAENTPPPPPPAEAQQSTEPAAPAPVQPAPATARRKRLPLGRQPSRRRSRMPSQPRPPHRHRRNRRPPYRWRPPRERS